MASADLKNLMQPFDVHGDETSVAQRWARWRRSFELFLQAKAVNANAQKKAYLLLCAGEGVQEIWETLPESAADFQMPQGGNVYSVCLDALASYFSPTKNFFYERYKFRKVQQLPSETSLQYLTRLSALIVNCDYERIERELLDMLIQHTLSHEIRKELLKEGDTLSLSRAKEIARALENSEMQSRAIEADEHAVQDSSSTIAALRNSAAIGMRRCFRCDSTQHLANDAKCPARNRQCNACGKLGHFQAVCQTSTVTRNNLGSEQRSRFDAECSAAKPTDKEQPERTSRLAARKKKYDKVVKLLQDVLSGEDDSEEDDLVSVQKGYMFHITEEVNHSVEKDVEVRLCGIPVSVFIDSGATVNVIDKKTWGYLKERRVKGECVADKKPLYAYGATAPLPVLGRFDAEISIDKNCINASFYVIDCDGSPLMGMQTAIDLGVLLMGKNFKNTGDSIVSDPSFHNIMNESHNKRAQCRTSFQQHRAVSATVRHIGKIPQREEMVSAREHDTRVASYSRATCKVNASSIVQLQREEGQPAKLAPTQAVVTDHAWRPQRAWRRCLH